MGIAGVWSRVENVVLSCILQVHDLSFCRHWSFYHSKKLVFATRYPSDGQGSCGSWRSVDGVLCSVVTVDRCWAHEFTRSMTMPAVALWVHVTRQLPCTLENEKMAKLQADVRIASSGHGGPTQHGPALRE